VLKVGYRPKNLPCSFLTPEGELVGFDVEMAHILAQDIGASLEFVPFEFDRLNGMLSSGQIDIAMSCIASLPDRYSLASFSRPYLDLTLAFVVPDHERKLYVVPKGDIEMMAFVSIWVNLKKTEATVTQLYDYWMLGGVSEQRETRWSLVRDVLGWVA
jgi:membrane-bound lytic murein transglycosylase MltF